MSVAYDDDDGAFLPGFSLSNNFVGKASLKGSEIGPLLYSIWSVSHLSQAWLVVTQHVSPNELWG